MARRYGKRGWSYGLTVFLAGAGLLFWDWLPMEISYKNGCEKKAGLTQYKTLEEWQAKNPGVWETLTPQPWERSEPTPIKGGYWTKRQLNERFSEISYIIKRRFSIVENQIDIIDMKTGEQMAVYVDFYTDFPFGETKLDSRLLRFWMVKGNCSAANEPLGWQKPRELRDRLDMERRRFNTLKTIFAGGSNK
jgi:hypothetical protein